MSQTVLIIVIGLCLVGVWCLSPALRRATGWLLFGASELKFEELPEMLDGRIKFGILSEPLKKLPGTSRSVQAASIRASIAYHVTHHGSGVTETVDIAYIGRGGMILTMQDGKVKILERVGGPTIRNPALTNNEQAALDRFMTQLRFFFRNA